MKVVINEGFGGFGLSREAEEYLNGNWWDYYENRSDPKLVLCVEELGAKANGMFSHLKVVEIPDGVDYIIQEYDGMESIAERHRTWS